MNKKINAFMFDCFGVISPPPLFGWYKKYMTDRGLSDDKLLDVFRNYDLNKISGENVAEYFSKYEGITSSKEEIQEQIDSYLKIDTELVNVIKQLKNKGYKTALLSNGNTAYFDRIVYPTYPEFKNLFGEIIISSDVGIVKPDKEIYLYALEKINSKPEESLFIDDNQTNIDGAVSVGINGYLYTDCDSFAEYIKKLGIDLNE
jgi:epoxide hydrolase-like predicted phosphatase